MLWRIRSWITSWLLQKPVCRLPYCGRPKSQVASTSPYCDRHTIQMLEDTGMRL